MVGEVRRAKDKAGGAFVGGGAARDREGQESTAVGPGMGHNRWPSDRRGAGGATVIRENDQKSDKMIRVEEIWGKKRK